MSLRETHRTSAEDRMNAGGDQQHTLRTGQGNGVLGQREGKEGNRAQKNPDVGKRNNTKKS